VSTTGYEPATMEEPEVSGTAVGGMLFAATMLTIIGTFQAIMGLVGIIDDNFYVVSSRYTFDLDTTAWGWIHLILGILVMSTGLGLFGRRVWAGVTAIAIVSLQAVANFFFVPYYPFWSLLVIALDVWVIWALTRPGAIRS
jgi:hypothetical protein